MNLADLEQQILSGQDHFIETLLQVMEKQGEDKAAQNGMNQEIQEQWLNRAMWKRVSSGFRLALDDLQRQLSVVELQKAGEEMLAGLKKLAEYNQVVEKVFEKQVHQLEQTADTLQELFGISDVVFEHFYQSGVRYDETGYFSEARDIFYCLSVLSPLRFTVWLSLGLVEKQLLAHSDALRAFAMAAILDPHAVLPHIYSSACYVAMHQTDLAETTLEYALDLIKEHPEDQFASEKSQILNMLAAIKKRS